MTTFLYKVRAAAHNRIRQHNGLIPLSDLEPLAGKVTVDGAPDSESGEWCLNTPHRTLKLTGHQLRKGDVLYLISSPGGAFGSPLDRDPELLVRDVWNERISIDFAARAYGVVIDPENLKVDYPATEELRAQLRARESDGTWAPPVAVDASVRRRRAAAAEDGAAGGKCKGCWRPGEVPPWR